MSSKNLNNSLEIPSNGLIDKYLEEFKLNRRYSLADNAIVNLFEKFPENKNIEDIILKISVINDLYSTNIYSTFKLAEYIQSLDIDKYLEDEDLTIVNKIAVGHGISKPKCDGDRSFYSFATKYCSWHKKDVYPIYDSFVEKILVAYQKQDKFSNFKPNDLREFSQFTSIIHDFRNYYKLSVHDLKEIDKFLWIYGKRRYSK